MMYTPMNCAQYALLEAVLDTLAEVGKTMSYAALATILGFKTPRDPKMHEVLGWALEHDHSHKHALRPATIVRQDTGLPGDEFFGLARRLGINIPTGQERSFHDQQLADLGVEP